SSWCGVHLNEREMLPSWCRQAKGCRRISLRPELELASIEPRAEIKKARALYKTESDIPTVDRMGGRIGCRRLSAARVSPRLPQRSLWFDSESEIARFFLHAASCVESRVWPSIGLP